MQFQTTSRVAGTVKKKIFGLGICLHLQVLKTGIRGLFQKMEFEEFMVLFGEYYGEGQRTAAFIGIRADESLHRYRAIASDKKGLMFGDYKWTTKVMSNLYNIYPIYDWKTQDIWVFHIR